MPSPYADVVESITSAFAKVDPQNPLEMEDLFAGLPELFSAITAGLKNLADKELPLKPAVTDELREMIAPVNGVRDKAEELVALFRRVHEPELTRAHDPRPGEKRWDVAGI